jgi:hypothetical protein
MRTLGPQADRGEGQLSGTKDLRPLEARLGVRLTRDTRNDR